jgi:CubicO group peptidase (beta-lactamase class C family)
MVDTDFWCPPEKTDRLAACYWRTATERMRLADGSGTESRRRSRPRFLSGAGGLLSTLADYHRFTDMLRRGGERNGARILSPRTLAFMTRNHLPGGRTLGDDAVFLEPARHGVGFGLGFAVVLDPAQTHQLCSPGEYYWGGAASTAFWVDPVEDVTVIFLTQLMPSSTYPLRPALRAGVYQALLGP